MKKPFNYTERDHERRCEVCRYPLKRNVLARQPAAKRCYRHGRGRQARRGRNVQAWRPPL